MHSQYWTTHLQYWTTRLSCSTTRLQYWTRRLQHSTTAAQALASRTPTASMPIMQGPAPAGRVLRAPGGAVSPRSYSARSVIVGSTRAARQAGIQQATVDAPASNATTPR